MQVPPWLAPFEPQLPLPELVTQVNHLFHEHSARVYDRDHPEIFEQLPPLWDEMLATLPQRTGWRVLDFGCGTGFEAAHVLRRLGARVASLTAYDPSPAMLERCRRRLEGTDAAPVRLCSTLAQVQGPFDLLLTNSLLHHLPDIPGALASLLPSLTPDAHWLAGHEPSVRFYRNPACVRFLSEYQRYRAWVKYLDPGAYGAKVGLLLGRHPLSATAREAVRRGLFKTRPDFRTIDRLVDFHVAHSSEEVSLGRGLDVRAMQQGFLAGWRLRWLRTYAYFGDLNPRHAPQRWQRRARALAEAFPDDGANFSAVWQRAP